MSASLLDSKNMVAFIIGGTSGIRRAIGLSFAETGAE
jgi:NAD(P)-dependent dehydrogenase (short-subunit alcohol dehydrogenase family)